jgi:hypothetical protein
MVARQWRASALRQMNGEVGILADAAQVVGGHDNGFSLSA